MDKTIDMAREANLAKYGNGLREGVYAFIDALKAFEALVRADEREKYEAIVASMTKLLEAQQKREGVAIDMIAASAAVEREALLDLVDDYAKNNTDLKAAIRARGQE